MALQFPLSGLLFDEEEHRYYYEGHTLKSVTTLLKETLFADKYSDVNPTVLANAAKFGTTVHRLLERDEVITPGMLEDAFCEVYETSHEAIMADEELHSIVQNVASVYGKANDLLENNNVDVLRTEYLVTDGRLAGSIDLVANVNGEPAIVDYKFTYNADIEYLSWQMSIYAYLFFKMTGQRLPKAYALWVPKRDASLGWFNPIPMKSDEEIENLITGAIEKKEDAFPVEIKEAQMALAQVLLQEKEIAERKKILQAALHQFMENNAIKQIKSDYYTISYVAPSVRKSLDTAALKKAHPEINLDDYQKSSNVKSSVKITLK